MKHHRIAFRLLTIISCMPTVLLGVQVQHVDLNPFSQEGRAERIQVRFGHPVQEPVFLEVYEFHPIMRPDLAPPEDTWTHQRQMEHMRLVQAGERSAYRPDSRDPKVQEILRMAQPRIYPMQPVVEAAFAAEWKAAHGRIYFRFRIGRQALAPVYSMRVHCRQADLRNVERLKQALQGLELPLRQQNSEMALKMLALADEAYRSGHGLRYMMMHHQEDPSRLDDLMRQLTADIADADWQNAQDSLKRLKDQVGRSEQHFKQALSAKTTPPSRLP